MLTMQVMSLLPSNHLPSKTSSYQSNPFNRHLQASAKTKMRHSNKLQLSLRQMRSRRCSHQIRCKATCLGEIYSTSGRCFRHRSIIRTQAGMRF